MPPAPLLRRLLPTILTLVLGTVPAAAVEQHIGFTGGPDGGTFQYFANGIASRLEQRIAGLHTETLPSAGSVENIRRLNAREADFGIAYAGDLFLAHRGLLNKDPQTYRNALALACLYGAPAQLVVMADSDIDTIDKLIGKRIAVGGAGSGSAATAQRFFSALGLWDKLRVEFVGYTKAAASLRNRTIDAMWIMAGYPTAAVSQLAADSEIRLLDTWQPAEDSALFQKFPFYTRAVIPAGAYRGVNRETSSFQDTAVWMAGSHVPEALVEHCLKEIFSPEGLTYLRKIKSTAKQMSIGTGLSGINTPLHPGARGFWLPQGNTALPEG